MGKERVVKPRPPRRWASDISAILNAVRGIDHFPISVPEVAIELSKSLFPSDPLTVVQGESLPGFEGALLRRGKGWGILYNNGITSRGRINFTLAHELGHYLLHRLAYPNGLRCSQQDVVRWEADYKQLENEANTFAAYLLMPLDDFRRRLEPRTAATFDLLSGCAKRYEVSLVAATLRWLSYTERRAVLVVSRDGYILWARSSEAAFRTGIYIKTSGLVVPVPAGSVAASVGNFSNPRDGIQHPPGIWFPEPCRETSLVSENYDFTLSLIQLPPGDGNRRLDVNGDEDVEDLSERIRSVHGLPR